MVVITKNEDLKEYVDLRKKLDSPKNYGVESAKDAEKCNEYKLDVLRFKELQRTLDAAKIDDANKAAKDPVARAENSSKAEIASIRKELQGKYIIAKAKYGEILAEYKSNVALRADMIKSRKIIDKLYSKSRKKDLSNEELLTAKEHLSKF